MSNSEDFLKTAIKLAEKGKGMVSPNPMVGAVIVKGKRILGQGYHKAFGMAHAEVEALKDAGSKAKGASIYLNLEPCCHHGKTPPCTRALVEAGIKEVVCSMEDPNPLVSGKGFEELERNGIKVRKGSMREEAEALNASYITNITEKRPYVLLKWAQTLDGKTASCRGDSKWITSESSREYAKRIRFEADGIIVGIQTLLNDNPSLDYMFPSSYPARMKSRKRYCKIILDPGLKTPLEGNIWNDRDSEILIVTSKTVPGEKIGAFSGKTNCGIIKLDTKRGRFSIPCLLSALYERNIGIVLVEGGSNTLTSFWEAGTADEAVMFISSRILGDNRAMSSVAGIKKEKISEATGVKIKETKMFGQDIMIRGKPCFRA